ncbi:signal peptidase I [Bacillus testis]|uniref:signal peptidase I n=1 Tax=Bacillus testis TaxID=1622072 RepID=UPI00067EBBA7|nr:signal peptidase I [Bacillus testis]
MEQLQSTEGAKKAAIQWLIAAIWGLLLIACIRAFLFSSYDVDGISMQPSLNDTDKLIVNKISYEFNPIKRFDIIVFTGDSKKNYVKRVIGLPGDRIVYKDDRLLVNGEYYQEPYLKGLPEPLLGQKETGDFSLEDFTGEKKVPEDMLFVMGDNRLNSLDSRHFGFIKKEKVVGKVVARYWPIDELKVGF